jgi:putative restriction endonuclease
VSGLDTRVWSEFEADPEAIAAEAEEAYATLLGTGETPASADPLADVPTHPEGPSEVERLVRTRRVQSFFRTAVLVSYGTRCAVTGISVPELLNASHIVPWAASVPLRADPRNGICLNALLDRAFDRGLVTFDDELRLVLSPRLMERLPHDQLAADFVRHEGKPMAAPPWFMPSLASLAFHRQNVFR